MKKLTTEAATKFMSFNPKLIDTEEYTFTFNGDYELTEYMPCMVENEVACAFELGVD